MAKSALAVFEEQHLAEIDQIARFETEIKKMEKLRDEVREKLQTAMEANQITKVTSKDISISLIPESESVSIDLKAFKEKEPEEYKGLLEDYPKTTRRKAYLRYVLRKE